MTEEAASRYRSAVRFGMSLIEKSFGHRLTNRERGGIRSLVRAGASVASAGLPQVHVSTDFSDGDLRLVREAVGAAVIHAVAKRA